MSFNTSIIALLLSAVILSTSSQAYTLYDDPFHIQPYITEPEKIIKKGMVQYGWAVLNENPGKIEALLDHKEYRVRVNIFYSVDKIWFESVSAENNNLCKQVPCEVEQRHLDRWRMGLRRGIAFAMTQEALRDAQAKAYK